MYRVQLQKGRKLPAQIPLVLHRHSWVWAWACRVLETSWLEQVLPTCSKCRCNSRCRHSSSNSSNNSKLLRQTAGSAAAVQPIPESSVRNAVSQNQPQQVRGSVAAVQRIPENSARNAANQDQQTENGSAAAEQKTSESSAPNAASREDNSIPMKEDSL